MRYRCRGKSILNLSVIMGTFLGFKKTLVIIDTSNQSSYHDDEVCQVANHTSHHGDEVCQHITNTLKQMYFGFLKVLNKRDCFIFLLTNRRFVTVTYAHRLRILRIHRCSFQQPKDLTKANFDGIYPHQRHCSVERLASDAKIDSDCAKRSAGGPNSTT